MGAGSTAKRRRTGTDSSVNSATPSRTKPATGRGRGRPPNAPRDGRERPPPLAECFRKRCNDVLDRLSKKDHYNIFLEPVNTDVVAGYADIIKRPMDFTTMRNKLTAQAYKSLGEFRKDLDLIWSNCLLFNGKEPNNIFSKKAIELRKLTEKLIVTTRQYLEKDKENLLKWREKHRRRKENMQANAANAQAALHTHTIGNPSLLSSRDRRTHLSTAARDPLDATTADYNNEDLNGRTPQQNAMAESLRLQYAGTTGLFKKSMVHAPLPQYTKPDGSVVQIPVRRYHPDEDHWGIETPSHRRQVIRADNPPTLLCDSLPSEPALNPCAPRPNMHHVLVNDYAESLHNFFKGTEMEHLGSHIVAELLSPELEVKKRQEQLIKQGFHLKDLENKARIAAARNPPPKSKNYGPPKHRWNAEAIVKLADDIEKANRRQVSLLPKLLRQINELDGIAGLECLLGKEIAKEVDEVPADVIDFSMPHGVGLDSLSEICQLQNAPSIKISQHDLQCIESLRKAAEDHVQNLGPEALAKKAAAAEMCSARLHEKQMRAKLLKQHWRAEAARQAKIIEDKQLAAISNRSNRAAVAHSGVDIPPQMVQRMTPGSRHGGRAAAEFGSSKRAVDTATAELQKGINMALRQAPAAGTTPGGMQWQKTGIHIPNEQAAEILRRRGQHPVGNAASNGLVPGLVNAKQSAGPHINGNGVANRLIQKAPKPSQTARRRSSPGGAHGKLPKSRISVGVPPFNHVPTQAMQGMANPASSAFIISNTQAAVAHGHGATPIYPGPRNPIDSRGGLVPQSIPQIQGGQKRESTESLTPGVSNGVRVATLQQQLRADMGQMMYRGQPAQAGAAMMPPGQPMGLSSQGQANLANRSSQAQMVMKPTNAIGQQPAIPNVSAPNPMASFANHLMQAKNHPLVMSMHDTVTHQVPRGVESAPTPQSTLANQLHQRLRRRPQQVQAQLQPGVQAGMPLGLQSVMQAGGQGVMAPTGQASLPMGVQHALAPRIQGQMQGGFQQNVQPVAQAQAVLQAQGHGVQGAMGGQGLRVSQAEGVGGQLGGLPKMGHVAGEAQKRQVVGQPAGVGAAGPVSGQEQGGNGQVNMGGERGNAGISEDMGISDIPSFMNNGGTSAGMLSNFGDGTGQNAFAGNGSGLGEGGLGSDQMADMDMIFGEGPIETPGGAPDFEF
eukprot:GFKZ01002055.1.p1 GENE.GFKZ01002055.1~~GFKZ01002055.1.p1  ORF type:complete len:1239 (-),score=184.59 GFKZ01002055.1:766-4305(-)